jgi:hypothetical protein
MASRCIAWAAAAATAAILLTGGDALALKPGTHAKITNDSCRAVGLGRDICKRIATENYDTDSREWDDLRAHAQVSDDQTACDAADAAVRRVHDLGAELRADLAAVASKATDDRVSKVASALGRALHTVQDNCAHHGMPNPQHAWYSLSDFCQGTDLSPDIQADAMACARRETDAIMALVAEEVASAGVAKQLNSRACPEEFGGNPSHGGSNNRTVCENRFLPGPIDACRFLERSEDWDGIDRTWNNDVMVAAVRGGFEAGVTGVPRAESVCHGDETVLSAAVSEPVVDVSGGTPTCGGAHLLCLGKVDDLGSPFDDYDVDYDDGGCAVGGGAGSQAASLLVGFAMLLAFRRRRR